MFKSFCNVCDEEIAPSAPTTSLSLPEYGTRVEVIFQPLPHGSGFHICRKCKIALLKDLVEHLEQI